ncbi:MAG: prepilin peptidase [Pseudonocardiaceae bacterium]
MRWVLARLRRGALVRPGRCEFGVAVLWALTGWWVGAGAQASAWLVVLLGLGWLAVALTATDVAHRRLPDALTLPALPAVLLLLLPLGPETTLRAVWGAVALVACHALVHLAVPSALGAGDVKLAGVVGAVLGGISWAALVIGPLLAALLTAAVGVIGLLSGRLGRSDQLPHGPAMLGAAWVLAVLATGA